MGFPHRNFESRKIWRDLGGQPRVLYTEILPALLGGESKPFQDKDSLKLFRSGKTTLNNNK